MSSGSLSTLTNLYRAAPQGHLPGTRIAGRYEIVDLLGWGAAGAVYKVVDHELGSEELAIKLLHPHLATTERALLRFRNELLLSRKLNHPNIVRMYEFGIAADEQKYISMEFVEGTSLSRFLKKKFQGELPFNRVVEILQQIAVGLAYAHSLDIIHRDVKPSNVLISSTGVVKLTDFGTARLLANDHQLTATGETLGTPYYMAPEQIRGEELDHRCDIYSFGITAYELCTGRRPFVDESYYRLAVKHLAEPLPTINSVNENVPIWFDDLLRKCTAKNRQQRFDSLAKVVELLASRFDQLGITQDAAALEEVWQRSKQKALQIQHRHKRRIVRRKALFAAMTALFLVIASMFAVRYSESLFMRTAWLVLRAESVLPATAVTVLKRAYDIPAGLSVRTGRMTEVTDMARRRETARLLCIAMIRAGGNLNDRDSEGRTPLMYAARQGDSRLALEMLKAGANPNSIDRQGNTALHHLAVSLNPELLQRLLRAGAQGELQNEDGETPLHLYAREGGYALIRKLANKRPKVVNIKNARDKTALHIAVLKLLDDRRHWSRIKSNGEVEARGRLQEMQVRLDVIDQLILAGADLHLPDGEGNSSHNYSMLIKLPAVDRMFRQNRDGQ